MAIVGVEGSMLVRSAGIQRMKHIINRYAKQRNRGPYLENVNVLRPNQIIIHITPLSCLNTQCLHRICISVKQHTYHCLQTRWNETWILFNMRSFHNYYKRPWTTTFNMIHFELFKSWPLFFWHCDPRVSINHQVFKLTLQRVIFYKKCWTMYLENIRQC